MFSNPMETADDIKLNMPIVDCDMQILDSVWMKL